MPPAITPAASTYGKFRPRVGFTMNDTNMLVGQTAIQESNAIFHWGGTLSFFDELGRVHSFSLSQNLTSPRL